MWIDGIPHDSPTFKIRHLGIALILVLRRTSNYIKMPAIILSCQIVIIMSLIIPIKSPNIIIPFKISINSYKNSSQNLHDET